MFYSLLNLIIFSTYSIFYYFKLDVVALLIFTRVSIIYFILCMMYDLIRQYTFTVICDLLM